MTIRIRIQPTLSKRTKIIGAVEPHQYRVERTITITQQIMPRHRFRSLPIEAQQAAQTTVNNPMTVSRVRNGSHAPRSKRVKYRTLLVRSNQGTIDLTAVKPLLREQLIAILND